MEQTTGFPLKKLDAKSKEFTANGVKYLIEDTISFQRWAVYKRLAPEVALGVDIKTLFEHYKKIYAAQNKMEFADSAVMMHNLMSGVRNLSTERYDPALKICTLFINAEGEDRRTIDEAQMLKKLQDWDEEGYDVNSFFQLALHSIPGFLDVYKSVIQDTSKENSL